MDRCRCAVVIWLWHKFFRLWGKLCAMRWGKIVGCGLSYHPCSYLAAKLPRFGTFGAGGMIWYIYIYNIVPYHMYIQWIAYTCFCVKSCRIRFRRHCLGKAPDTSTTVNDLWSWLGLWCLKCAVLVQTRTQHPWDCKSAFANGCPFIIVHGVFFHQTATSWQSSQFC